MLYELKCLAIIKKDREVIRVKRMIMEDLKRWKDKKRRKPLLLTGVRQCGKTYILRQFAEECFEDSAYFNFDSSDALASVFSYDFNIKRILQELEIINEGKKITPGKTLVIFDEVQACSRAITSLKYFCENLPDLHLIAAGSLLGVALRDDGVSFPVGKVDRMEMYPMTFSEFVCTDGGENIFNGLDMTDLKRELPSLYTVPMEKYLKNYYIVGGMPEAVQVWVETHDYRQVEEVQDQILKDYPDDFGKHLPKDRNPAQMVMTLQAIWDSVPAQIARDNNKFIFSHVKKGARSKDLEDALQWLMSAGLVYRLHLVEAPEIPLSGMADAAYFKVYMADVGLLRRKAGLSYRTILEGSELFIRFKGALAENYVMEELKAMGFQPFFWRTKTNAEIDFVVENDGMVIPIEVKSADNTKAKSLHSFCNRYEPETAVKTSLKNVGDNMDGKTQVWSIPLYALFKLRKYLES